MSKNRTSTINVDRELINTIQSRIVRLLDQKNGQWTGTMTDLSNAITTGIRRARLDNWPSTPSVMRRVVNVVVPSLRKVGVRVQFGRTTDHMRTRFVSFVSNNNQ